MKLSRRSLLAAGGLAALALASGLALLVTPSPRASEGDGPVFTEDGFAIRGYDPVAYFTEGRPVEGSAEHEAQWSGATWRFASGEHRERFLDDPEAYAPQYGGYCAWAVAEKGELFSVDPDAWRIVDGRLYLNYNHSIQRRWEQDIPGFIEAGNRRWPEIIGEG